MKYKIIVDKQSRTNPSSEKREYEIDIEELRVKGDIYDSLVITKDEDYVMRRLSLSEYQVLTVLPESVKEPLQNINIELFEGDNYIYLVDMIGNRFYAEYLVKNDFTDTYITKSEANSAIEQSAKKVEISVNEKLTSYSTAEETSAIIEALSKAITLELKKKINDKDLTGASIALRINDDTSEAKINADKIELTANDILNLIAGNSINLTSKNINISSTGFNVDKDGKVTIIDKSKDGESSKAFLTVESSECDWISDILSGYINLRQYKNSGTGNYTIINPFLVAVNYSSDGAAIDYGCSMNANEKKVMIDVFNQFASTEITPERITTPTLTQTSQEESKKNFEKLENGLDILKQVDIYKYNLKSQKDEDKKHIGFVIGKDYKYSSEITAINEKGEEVGVDIYSMISVLWKAVQEQQELIEKLEKRVQQLEVQNGQD